MSLLILDFSKFLTLQGQWTTLFLSFVCNVINVQEIFIKWMNKWMIKMQLALVEGTLDMYSNDSD
jgi:hypothetical protein